MTPTNNIFTDNETLVLNTHGASEVFRQLILGLFNGYIYPMPVMSVSCLDHEHFRLFMNMLETYHRDGETEELRMLARKILAQYPEMRPGSLSSESDQLNSLREAVAFYDLCQTDPEAGATGAKADAREKLLKAARELIASNQDQASVF